MDRYNIFHLIHKGLRASLYHTSLQLQQTDFTVEDETEAALNRVKEIIMLFEGHAHKEDSFILPAIMPFEPSVAACFEDEHKKDEELGRQLNDAIVNLEKSNSPLEQLAAGRLLVEGFESFLVFNLQHMAKEEDVINKILWRYFQDQEIRLISSRISESIAPWMQDFYATWMLRGISNNEAATWLKAIEAGMPAVVFQSLLQKAEQELPEQRLRKITQTLTEGLMVA
ncbi:MAG: hemerythrin domain-containing protein [Flavisolibacter sp.]